MGQYHRTGFFVGCLALFSAVFYSEAWSDPAEDPVIFANLNLNRQGRSIRVFPNEKIFATLNIDFEESEMEGDPHLLHQIIVGYEGKDAQKCILNEYKYRLGNVITSFFLQAPEEPGVYMIQVQVETERSPIEAMQYWDKEGAYKKIVGEIVVLEQ